jgi:hypothetical protein
MPCVGGARIEPGGFAVTICNAVTGRGVTGRASNSSSEAAMADVSNDPRAMAQEVHQHEETFHSFNKLVLFAILNAPRVGTRPT